MVQYNYLAGTQDRGGGKKEFQEYVDAAWYRRDLVGGKSIRGKRKKVERKKPSAV